MRLDKGARRVRLESASCKSALPCYSRHCEGCSRRFDSKNASSNEASRAYRLHHSTTMSAAASSRQRKARRPIHVGRVCPLTASNESIRATLEGAEDDAFKKTGGDRGPADRARLRTSRLRRWRRGS